MEISHTFKSQNATLSAVWHQGPSKNAPVVIFHHGFGGNRVEAHRMFVKMARKLSSRGIDSFRFDFFGAGESEGNLTDATISLWIHNALDAANHVKSQHKTKIFLLGFSLGAFVAAAAAPHVQPCSLILWAPIFHPLKRILREKEMIDQARETGIADYQGELLKYSLVEDASQFAIPAVFEGYTGPVFVSRGTKDESALLSESKQFTRFYRKQECDVHFHGIPNANHSFDHHNWETDLIDKTIVWIEKQIAGPNADS